MYSNLDETLPAAGAGSEGGCVAEHRIQESGSRQYLILTNQIPLRNRNLTNTYIRDISGIYSDRKNQYSYFLKLCAVISVIMAGGMYFMIRHLTKTLRVLTESVKKIERGIIKRESVFTPGMRWRSWPAAIMRWRMRSRTILN